MADLSGLYTKLIDFYDAALDEEDVPLEILKEVRELLKAMKYEAMPVPGSKTAEVAGKIERTPPKFG